MTKQEVVRNRLAPRFWAWLRAYLKGCGRFLRRHRIGTLVLLGATILFFWPLIIRLGTYSPGGDAMFNAWEIGRNQHCILRQDCPVYADANIFYPHKDAMLYSESQISAAVATLPLRLVTQNLVLQYNLLTVVLFFMSGWCMYLLAKYLSRGNEWVSIVAGLVFEFAPLRLSAIWHLQNLSIFCLPLAVLIILKYFERQRTKYLWYLLVALLYVFFASWVQMVFVLVALGILLLGLRALKAVAWRPVLMVAGVVAAAALATAPLAVQYIQFSKDNKAGFSILDQETYGASLADYLIPPKNSLLGKLYHAVLPDARRAAYNKDSASYDGVVLYAVGTCTVVLAFLGRKSKRPTDRRQYAFVVVLVVIAVAGFLISIGPFLKIKGNYLYPVGGGLTAVIPTPYALVDKLLPQLNFIRAVGRAGVLFLFALCCLLALFPVYLERFTMPQKRRRLLMGGVYALLIVELLPLTVLWMSSAPQAYHMQMPAVYQYVLDHEAVNDIAILQGNDDYPDATWPIAWGENILWAGYDNRNVFNGYSGYMPPEYMQQYIDFINFNPSSTPAEMKSLGIRYVVINKDLSGPTSKKPHLLRDVSATFPLVYADAHYALFRVN